MSRCICGTCPTYIEGDTGFFCSLDFSKKGPVRRGCVCSECSLWPEYELSGGYFCINGKAG